MEKRLTQRMALNGFGTIESSSKNAQSNIGDKTQAKAEGWKHSYTGAIQKKQNDLSHSTLLDDREAIQSIRSLEYKGDSPTGHESFLSVGRIVEAS